MTDSYDYSAPQYVDFTESSSALNHNEYGDDYFDKDHEIVMQYTEEIVETSEFSNKLNIIDNNISDLEYYSPDSTATRLFEDEPNEEDKENCFNGLRRSVSAGDIRHIIHEAKLDKKEIQNVCNQESNLCEAFKALEMSSKKNPRILNGVSKKVLTIKPNVIQNNFTNKRSHSTTASSENLEKASSNKFISTAEYVKKFQLSTPDRFHSKSKNEQVVHIKQKPLTRTIPQSPQLNTKSRTRAVYYTPYEQKEKKEYDEMKKQQFKAHPINHKIFGTPKNPSVAKKPVTIPEPFHITEVKSRKPPSPVPQVFEFHAKPAPKAIQHPVIKQNLLTRTIPITPSFMKKKYKQEKVPAIDEQCIGGNVRVKSVNVNHEGIDKTIQLLTKTKPKPFSFEQRDKRLLEKKEEKIKQFLEEEKKKREFHARPIPAALKIGSVIINAKFSQQRTRMISKSLENVHSAIEPTTFKARPATVIHKKPFVPKKSEVSMIQINEFNLSSEKRAKDREEYDKKLREKEEEKLLIKKQHEEELEKYELECIAQFRKETVHKAHPIRHYKPVEFTGSTKKLTSPVTPNFHKLRKHAHNES